MRISIQSHLPLVLSVLLALSSLGATEKESPDVNEPIRFAAAEAYLKENPKHLAVYTKGLVCSSCGIGLRIHLSRLKEIDSEKYTKGILLDAPMQLLVIAFKPGTDIDISRIQKAIDKAGYDVGHYYLWTGEGIERYTVPPLR